MLNYTDTPQFIIDFKQYLSDNGISNAHVARKMGISPQQLQNVYKKKELTVVDLQAMCNAINYTCTVDIKPSIG